MRLLLILISLSASLYAGDWPCWRGPDGNNISKELNWHPEALETGDVIQWKANIGRGHSSVIVVGNRVFTQGLLRTINGADTTFIDRVVCLDTKSGRELWVHTFPGHTYRFTVHFPGPGATPTWDAGRIYAQGREGDFFCLDAKNGKIIWQRHLPEDRLGKLPSWGFCASPVVDGNRLLINAGASGICLDKANGKVIWQSDFQTGGMSTPHIFHQDGQKVAILSSDKAIFIVDPETGKVHARHGRSATADPILLNRDFFLTDSWDHGCVRIRRHKDEFQQIWQNKEVKGSFMSAVLLKDNLYTMSNRRGRQHKLVCMDAKTGETQWQESMGEYGALAAAGDWLIVLDGSGELILSRPDKNGLQPAYRLKVLTLPDRESIDNMEWDFIWSAPVLANGRIFCRGTNGDLVCLDVSR